MSSSLSRCLILALAVLVSPGPGRAADLAYPGAETPAEPALPPLPDLEPATVDLGMLRERALGIAETYPAEDYFVEPLAAALGSDALAAFAYVRDRIALDLYEGWLRDPTAVLGARAGSSADKAVLLVALLRQMGVEARFAIGTLDAAGIERLRAAALLPRAATSDDLALASLAGLSEAALERLAARARRDFAWLWAAAGERLTPVPPPAPAARHVWVQALIAGAWVDLDPALPAAEAGAALATLDGVAETLPEELVHRIEIALVAESFDGSLPQPATLLQRAFSAPESGQTHVFLTFAPQAAESVAGIGEAVTGALGEATIYLPTLVFGEEVVQGAPLPPLPPAAAGGGFGDVQDFLFGGGGGDGGALPAQLVALYLEVTVLAPGQGPQTRRRVLLDRVAPAAREAGQLAAEDLAPASWEKGVPKVYRAIHQLMFSTGGANPRQTAFGLALAAEFLATHMASEEDFGNLSLPEKFWPLGAFNDALLLASERLTIGALNDRADLRFFAGTARLAVVSLYPASIRGRDGLSFTIDLLLDGIAAVAGADVPAAAVVERRLWYGVLQSALETTVGELRVGALAPKGRELLSTSTEMTAEQAVLEAADVEGQGAPAALQLAIAGGELVVANAGAAPATLTSWWTVNQADGTTRAVLALGLGGVGGDGRPSVRGYVNSQMPQRAYHIDWEREAKLSRQPANRSCRAGPEYLTILGCVSLPGAMATGTAYALIVIEIVALAIIVIAAAS